MRMFFAAGLARGYIGLIFCGLALQTTTSINAADVQEVGSPLTESCPPNYVWVPGNPTPGLGTVANKDGVAPFCIAKFEMKHPTFARGRGHQSDEDHNAVPVSQPEHQPWTFISHVDSHAACERVKIPGFTVALISNGEWQAVARNIESTAANWSGGKVGEGVVPRGHSDYGPVDSLPVTSEADPYDGTGNSASNDWEQKRTYQLSTGESVWDLAGNVWEWVDEGWVELGAEHEHPQYLSWEALSQRNRILFGPVGVYTYHSNKNMGVFSMGNLSAVKRGGDYKGHDFGLIAGLFSTRTGEMPNEHDSVGFRCVAKSIGSSSKRSTTITKSKPPLLESKILDQVP